MRTALIPEFTCHNASELAEFLHTVETWDVVERVTTDYAAWKVEAWNLLSTEQQERLKTLQKWKDHPVAQQFPPGVVVQRRGDAEELAGEVTNYWQAYGIDYVTFMVGPDVDWCRASLLERVESSVETAIAA